MIQEWTQECQKCKGTGLYSGMGEGAGLGVECYACKGTGEEKMRFKYEPFAGRKTHPTVTHVIPANPGVGMNVEWLKGQGHDTATVEEWKANPASIRKAGREVRTAFCPAWWYQSVDYKKKPTFDDNERKCDFGAFSACRFFGLKAGCWDKWDREFGTGDPE